MLTAGMAFLQAHKALELAQHVPIIHFPEAERVNINEAVDKDQYRRAAKGMRATMVAVYKRHSQLARALLDAPVAATCALHSSLWPLFLSLLLSACLNMLPLKL